MLRDRLIAARELLADTGSIFVQISDENLHIVRNLLDEVFGKENFCSLVTFQKTAAVSSPEARTNVIGTLGDYLLWYGRALSSVKYRQLYLDKGVGEGAGEDYRQVLLSEGYRRPIRDEEINMPNLLPAGARVFQATALQSPGFSATLTVPTQFQGRTFAPKSNSHWKTTLKGIGRLAGAGRVVESGANIRYVRCVDDFPVSPLGNIWGDTMGAQNVVYAVQTNAKVIERCMLMTTDPGDLVLDPTCGSGTTAYVAEQWGRRWITTDTSRVAVSIARQRLLTAKFDAYQIKEAVVAVPTGGGKTVTTSKAADKESSEHHENPGCGFRYKSVPHVTLKSIAQNDKLDPIFAKHEPILDAKLKACNAALAKVTTDLRIKLAAKLGRKWNDEGARATTDADRRRWLMPGTEQKHLETAFSVFKKLKAKSVADALEAVPPNGHFEHWHVPFDTDDTWPSALQQAVTDYRVAWRAKMDEVNKCIADNAEQEELVDQPLPDKSVKLRVSGPFTVEAVQPPEINLGDVIGQFDGEPGAMPDFTVREATRTNEFESQNVEAYLTEMARLLRGDGVRFPNNKEMRFSRLERIADGSGLHAEGRWVPRGGDDADRDGEATVGVVFGPQYGPITVKMLEPLIKPAGRRYDDLVIAAFNFTAEVQDLSANPSHPKLKIHVAHIRPDVNPGMTGLLKETPGSQLFTVFGQPRTSVSGPDKNGEYTVEMEGVDVYNPVTNTLSATGAEKVAAWFLDGDYDGRTFCVTQAFFPDKGAWEKLAKALGGVVGAERFEALSGTTSLPFPKGKHGCAAVKVIDPRGNEVMQVHKLGGK